MSRGLLPGSFSEPLLYAPCPEPDTSYASFHVLLTSPSGGRRHSAHFPSEEAEAPHGGTTKPKAARILLIVAGPLPVPCGLDVWGAGVIASLAAVPAGPVSTGPGRAVLCTPCFLGL